MVDVVVGKTLSNGKLLVALVAETGQPNCCLRLVMLGGDSSALCMQGLLGTDCAKEKEEKRKLV